MPIREQRSGAPAPSISDPRRFSARCLSALQRGPARSSFWPRKRPASSSTTTSVPSTSCSACSAKRRVSAARVLESLDITVERVRAQVVRIVGSGEEVTSGQIPFTPRAKKVLELALREALSLGHNYIGTEHILLGLVRENEGVAARILLDFDADSEKIRNEVIRMLSGPGGRRQGQQGAGAGHGRGQEVLEAARPVRPQPHQARRRGQARSGRRSRERDRADHADPLAPHQEQPGADRRAGSRQDRRGRGPGPAHHQRRGARAAQEQADLHARPGRPGGRLEVPRRVRGAPQEGDEGDHPARRHHPVHRRAAQPRRRRRRRGRDRRRLHPQAGAGPRRAADDRRHHARRVPQVPRARLGARASLPADPRRPAVRSTRPSRSCAACASATSSTTASRSPTRRSPPPRSWPTATSRTASCPTRPST